MSFPNRPPMDGGAAIGGAAIAGVATGGAAQTSPVNGHVPPSSRPDLIQSARDTLFTSGSLGRYSKKLNSVVEAPGELYSGQRP